VAVPLPLASSFGVCKPANAANKFYSKFTCPKGKEEAGSGGTTATKIYLPEGDVLI